MLIAPVFAQPPVAALVRVKSRSDEIGRGLALSGMIDQATATRADQATGAERTARLNLKG